MPARPGFNSSSASFTSRVTSSVFAPGNLSTTISMVPFPLLETASPISGGWLSTTRLTSPMRRALPFRRGAGPYCDPLSPDPCRFSAVAPSIGTLASCAGVTVGRMCLT